MCRLFGFRSSVESRAHRSLIVAENAVADQANYHADGWGIGYYIHDDAYLFRSPVGAAGDASFRKFSEGLRSHALLVHIRKATVGSIDPINSHPFRYGSWMFAHNGTIFDFEQLHPRIWDGILPEYQRVLFGSTDSEHIFFFILSEMVRGGACIDGKQDDDHATLVAAQHKAISQIFAWAQELNLEAPKINYILTNGKYLFARRAGLELYLATQKKLCPDALTCVEKDKICLAGVLPKLQQSTQRKCNHVLVASEPIGTDDIWEEIPDGAMISLDLNFRLHLHEKISPFWVTWPEGVTKHPCRSNIIPVDQ